MTAPRNKKVVQGEDLLFKDDIQIIDAELMEPLTLPLPLPVISRDELQVMYNGHVYSLTDQTRNAIPGAEIKIYTCKYGLQELETPQAQEEAYLKANAAALSKMKSDFIDRVVNGVIPDEKDMTGTLGELVSVELIRHIDQKYAAMLSPKAPSTFPGKGEIAKLNDGSIFNTHIKDAQRILLLDQRIYLLQTIPEYISIFEKSIEQTSGFYATLQRKASSSTPEDIVKYMQDNSDKIHRKALSPMADKIWHSERSFKLLLDGTYWIPMMKGPLSDIANQYQRFINQYQRLIEWKIKVDAAKEFT